MNWEREICNMAVMLASVRQAVQVFFFSPKFWKDFLKNVNYNLSNLEVGIQIEIQLAKREVFACEALDLVNIWSF